GLAPGVDAPDDEQALTRLDEPETARLQYELATGADRRDLPLELTPLRRERRDLRLAAVQLLLRAQVGVQRLPVQEPEHDYPTERQKPSRPQHERSFALGTTDPSDLTDANEMQAFKVSGADGRARKRTATPAEPAWPPSGVAS